MLLRLMTLLALALPISARAEGPTARGPAFPLQLTHGLGDCDEGCFRADAAGALLCLEHEEMINCGTCRAAWFGADAKAPAWSELVSCVGESARVHRGPLAALNTRAAKAGPVAPVFEHVAWSEGRAHPIRTAVGDVTFDVSAEALTVLRGDTVVDAVAWTPPTRTTFERGETARIEVYPLGAGWLANVSYRAGDVGASSPSRWVALGLGRDVTRDPAPLAPDASLLGACPPEPEVEGEVGVCPFRYDTIAAYLARYCAGTLTPGHLAALELVASGRDRAAFVSDEGLVALFNMHGAMWGYVFKAQRQLNHFFYDEGRAWLPEACRALPKRFAREADVPASFKAGRDVTRGLWQARQQKR